MTNHWVDLKNANVLLIMGSNAVENHPIASAHMWKAKDTNNATIIHVDPRFTRTSAKADIYAPIRSGTDIAFLGGMIRWAIEEWYNSGKTKYLNQKYIEDCTNGLFKVHASFETCRDTDHLGLFSGAVSGSNPAYTYNTTTWDYQYDTDTGTTPPIKRPFRATSLDDLTCVFQKLAEHYGVTFIGGTPPYADLSKRYDPDSPYSVASVEKICGTPAALFEQICEAYIGGTYADNKAGTMLYAMGWTQHTVGTQNIRCASILQSLLGNIGVAGSGIDALRGWHNVQGATDHGVLMHLLPGYLAAPPASADYSTLGTGPMDASNTYLKMQIPLAMDPDSPTPPQSAYWWGIFAGQYNRARYMVSLLKAWWPTDKSTLLPLDPQVSYSYLPKRAGDSSYLSLFNEMAKPAKPIKGLFVWGSNPMVMGPDQNLERSAMDNLEWLVVCDCFKTETAEFWNRPGGPGPGAINTEVYLLPGAVYSEKKGSASNSGRLIQWRDKASDPPGDAKDETEILADLGTAIQGLYSGSGLAKDAPIKNLNWPYDTAVLGSDLIDGVAKEENGYALVGFTTPAIAGATATYTAGQQIANFFHLDSTGKTACGNWLFCGTWQASGNQMRNRDPIDYHPYQIGIYHKWGYSWPVNRRIIYNRAAVYQSTSGSKIMGQPLNPSKPVVWWDSGYRNVFDSGTATSGSGPSPSTLTDTSKAWGTLTGKRVFISAGTGSGQERLISSNTATTLTVSTAWVTNPAAGSQYTIMDKKWNWDYNNVAKNPLTNPNDVIDGFGVNSPAVTLPYIMNREGVAKLMGIKALADGPFPEHYEPWESPLSSNPLTNGAGPLSDPVVWNYYKTYATSGDPNYPYVCTTYRLTEHWHGGGFTRNCPTQCQLMPEPFIEISEELAAIKGISNGDNVLVTSARGSITLKACVTKRFKPFVIDGNTVHQVGMPWHWGWKGVCSGASANVLTPFIGDVSTRIPETKVFLVDIQAA